MLLDAISVALLPCSHYRTREIIEKIDRLCDAIGFRVSPGTRVLLKPNLLRAGNPGHLACTDPSFIAAAAEWFVNQGTKVVIGDSPAFGTARGVLRAIGAERALARLPVASINFDRAVPTVLAGGVTVDIAAAALECDILVNLPRVKAHGQLYMTLAVKNYFGTVTGFQKPWWHLRYGNRPELFAAHIVDLLTVLPGGVTLVDGIVAMEGTGPVAGGAFPLGVVGGAVNPVALDTALLQLLGLEMTKSPVWRECARRSLTGAEPDALAFPLHKPGDFSARDFRAPAVLKPVSFNPLRMTVSGCKRFAARMRESP